MRPYYANMRIHDPAYLIHHVGKLKEIGINNNNSSSLIYACLELRTILELIEFQLLLASVGEEFRLEITELTKTKNGIEKANKKLKSLKEKFQLFYQAVCEVIQIPGKYFDVKKSDNLQFRLSKYLHTYARTQLEIDYNSEFMNSCLTLIDETIKFIENSLKLVDGNYIIQNIDIKLIPNEDLILLEEWKNSTKMTYEELKNLLKVNLEKRS